MRYSQVFSGCLLVACVALGGCTALETAFPQTTAGFKANGVVGAVDGASGAVVAICEDLDGQQFRVAIDNLADEIGADTALDRVRQARQKACGIAGGAKDVTDAVLSANDQSAS
ncbi:MAG: hypothetical protein AAF674_19700 [Pseudomonadota bacterium]